MAVLITEKFKFEGRGGELVFNLKININKDGLFTAYYPDNAIDFLKKRFINIQYGRGEKIGYIAARSLGDFKSQVDADFKKALECKTTNEHAVIKYKIQTAASFCIDKDNNIYPDGSFGDYAKNKIWWHKGKTESNSTHPVFYGFNVFAELFMKTEYKTVEGVKYEYSFMGDDKCEELGKEAGILGHWRAMSQGEYSDYELDEIVYTEKNAKFFNSLIFNICQMVLRIDKLTSPKELQKLIDGNLKLLT